MARNYLRLHLHLYLMLGAFRRRQVPGAWLRLNGTHAWHELRDVECQLAPRARPGTASRGVTGRRSVTY